jgi:hypothetical protein
MQQKMMSPYLFIGFLRGISLSPEPPVKGPGKKENGDSGKEGNDRIFQNREYGNDSPHAVPYKDHSEKNQKHIKNFVMQLKVIPNCKNILEQHVHQVSSCVPPFVPPLEFPGDFGNAGVIKTDSLFGSFLVPLVGHLFSLPRLIFWKGVFRSFSRIPS